MSHRDDRGIAEEVPSRSDAENLAFTT